MYVQVNDSLQSTMLIISISNNNIVFTKHKITSLRIRVLE